MSPTPGNVRAAKSGTYLRDVVAEVTRPLLSSADCVSLAGRGCHRHGNLPLTPAQLSYLDRHDRKKTDPGEPGSVRTPPPGVSAQITVTE
jgi:hypothetical protein